MRTSRGALLAAALLGCTMLATACSAADANSGGGSGVRVERVASDRVERQMAAAFAAPDDEATNFAPATCVKDRDSTWFLPVYTGGGTGQVVCKVPRGARLVVNSGGYLCAEDEVDTADVLVERCKGYLRDIPGVQAVIVDGVEIDEMRAASTRVFTLQLVEPNVLDLPAGPTKFVYSGRTLTLAGLGDGVHTIRVMRRDAPQAEGDPFDVDLTYTVTVG